MLWGQNGAERMERQEEKDSKGRAPEQPKTMTEMHLYKRCASGHVPDFVMFAVHAKTFLGQNLLKSSFSLYNLSWLSKILRPETSLLVPVCKLSLSRIKIYPVGSMQYSGFNRCIAPLNLK